jgi:lysyl endopeptidase
LLGDDDEQSADSAPYVLTANHCVSDQGVAFSVEALWFFKSTQCNSNVPGPGILSPVGASVLNTEVNSDHTLLRMLSGVPDGLTFSGWATVAVGNGAGVFGLHHPDASFLRRSTGSVIGTNTGCPTSGVVGGYRVAWSSGATEPGSDGSGLFSSANQLLVGVDSCGFNGQAFCGNDAVYGKFSNFFPDIQDFLVFGDRGKNPVTTSIGNSHIGSLTSTSSFEPSGRCTVLLAGLLFHGPGRSASPDQFDLV